MKVRCIKVSTKNMVTRHRDITVGKVYEAIEEGLFYKLRDDLGDMWSYENEMFEEVITSPETDILDFIKTHKLDYFTANVIKCLIKFNQTQDKQYITEALEFIERLV